MADLRTAKSNDALIEKQSFRLVSREAQARGSSHDPGVPRRPHFSRRFSMAKLGRETRRENGEGWVQQTR